MFGLNQLTFKIFTYWNEDSKPEVRRFAVEKYAVQGIHKQFLQKLLTAFPRLKTKTYSLTWEDEDGDDITISSNEELQNALSILNGNRHVITLKVHVDDVLLTGVLDNPTAGPSNLMHRGVNCDGCNSTIVGFRYKCSTCIDFDLCSKCEAAGSHAEHCMVRIPSPVMPHDMITSAIKKSRHPESFVNRRRPNNGVLSSLATVLDELARVARDIDDKPGARNKGFHSNGRPQFPGHQVRPVIGNSPCFGQAAVGTQGSFLFGTAQPQGSQSSAFGNAQPGGFSLPSGPQPQQNPNTQPEPAVAETEPTTEPELPVATEPEPTTDPSAALNAELGLHHPKPHINSAIDHLLAIGYTNKGGWLTQLVEREDGDVTKVMEYLPAEPI